MEVDLESKSGLIVDSESESINVIPANSVYYLGGDTFPDSKVRKVEASVTVGSSESAQYALPKISHVTVGEDFGDTFVKGIVTNPYTQALSDTAQISIVLFGPTGKVVGGGFTYLDNPLKPGRSAMFSSTNGVDVTPRSSIAKVGVSMDNESE